MKKEIWSERNVKNVINYRKNEIIYTFNNYYQGRRPEGGKQGTRPPPLLNFINIHTHIFIGFN